jgi:GxxExxY protein
MLIAQELTERVIGLAIQVHRHTGPGLLESVYERCLCYELHAANIQFEHQVQVPIIYKGTTIEARFRSDIVVDRTLIVEIKGVESLLPMHNAQLLTYLRMSGLRIGLLLNFHAVRLKDGMRRFVV